jgi:hypothetical protein
MRYNCSITDLATFESDSVTIELEERVARIFAVRMAHDLLKLMPELASRGLCMVVYDIDDQPVSIVPLDTVQ